MVGEKNSSRHALGECVSYRAPAGADTHWANRHLAEFRRMGTECCAFFALSVKTKWRTLQQAMADAIDLALFK
jgi:hypothetical protein